MINASPMAAAEPATHALTAKSGIEAAKKIHPIS
jgi:hypothetical protein